MPIVTLQPEPPHCAKLRAALVALGIAESRCRIGVPAGQHNMAAAVILSERGDSQRVIGFEEAETKRGNWFREAVRVRLAAAIPQAVTKE